MVRLNVKRIIRVLLTACIIAAAAYSYLVYSNRFAINYPRHHYTDSDACGEWVGFTDGDVETFKLVLATNHTGTLDELKLDEGKHHYEVAEWSVISNRAICRFQPTTNLDIPNSLRCAIRTPNWLESSLTWSNTTWKDNIIFRRLSNLESNLADLDVRICTEGRVKQVLRINMTP